ncbi:hypothetical protein Hanom_Chr14g01282771 [Helianthus anomalus]
MFKEQRTVMILSDLSFFCYSVRFPHMLQIEGKQFLAFPIMTAMRAWHVNESRKPRTPFTIHPVSLLTYTSQKMQS